MLAVAVLRLQQHLLVLLHHIDDVQLDAQLLRHPQGVVALRLGAAALADGVGVTLHAEAGEKVDALHMHALLHDPPWRPSMESSPPGNEGNGFDLSGHSIQSLGGARSLRCQEERRNDQPSKGAGFAPMRILLQRVAPGVGERRCANHRRDRPRPAGVCGGLSQRRHRRSPNGLPTRLLGCASSRMTLSP